MPAWVRWVHGAVPGLEVQRVFFVLVVQLQFPVHGSGDVNGNDYLYGPFPKNKQTKKTKRSIKDSFDKFSKHTGYVICRCHIFRLPSRRK